jgi:hypothetical protein
MATYDWRSIADEREKYQAYLCSQEWWSKRNAVIDRSGGRCEKCNCRDADHVHHLTYIRKYNELLSDLIAICKRCHDQIHHSKCDTSASIRKPAPEKPSLLSPLERELLELFTLSPLIVPIALERVHQGWLQSHLAVQVVSIYRDLDLQGKSLDFTDVLLSVSDPKVSDLLKDLHRVANEKLKFTKLSAEARLNAIAGRVSVEKNEQLRKNRLLELQNMQLSAEDENDVLHAVLSEARKRQGA